MADDNEIEVPVTTIPTGNVLTSSEDYATIINAANDAIESFIANHGALVKYETKNDGYSYITLNYGSVRDGKLKKIAEMVNGTLNDAQYKIGDLPCEIIYASDLILKFKGATTAVETALKGTNNEALSNLVARSKVNTALPEGLVNNIITFLADFIAKRSTHTEAFLKTSGLSFYEFGGRGHVGIDVEKIAKNDDMSTTYAGVVLPIMKAFDENSKLISTQLSTELASYDIALERVNKNQIMFAYKLEAYDEKTIAATGGYVRIPNKITRIVVHIGEVEHYTLDGGKESPNAYIDADGALRKYETVHNLKLLKNANCKVINIDVDLDDTNTINDIISAVYGSNKVKTLLTSGNYGRFVDYETPPEVITNAIYENGLSSINVSDSTGCFIVNNSNFDDTISEGSSDSEYDISLKPFSEYNELNITDGAESDFRDGASVIDNALKTGKALNIIIPVETFVSGSDDGCSYTNIRWVQSESSAEENA